MPKTTCLFEADIAIHTELWGDEVSWNLLNEDGVVVASGSGYQSNSSDAQTVCLEDSCYTLELHDSFGDGWNGATISINYAALGIMVGPLTMEQGSFCRIFSRVQSKLRRRPDRQRRQWRRQHRHLGVVRILWP